MHPSQCAERHRLEDFQAKGELLLRPLLQSGYSPEADAKFVSSKLPPRTRLGIMLALSVSSWSFVLILSKLIYSAVIH